MRLVASDAVAEAPPEFSLVRGGPLYDLTQRLRTFGGPLGQVRLGVGIALVAWVPLLALAVLEGSRPGEGATISFLASLNTHVRFLIAIPLAFVAELWIDPRLHQFVQGLVTTRLVPRSDLPSLERAVRLAHRLRDSVMVEVTLAVLALASVHLGVRPFDLPTDISSWRATGTGEALRPTLAGWWYAAVALPIYQFLLARWIWRIVVWAVFLRRLARLRLQLIPTHPDLVGGLGYLPVAQSHFEVLCLAFAAVAAATQAERMWFAGAPLESFTLPALGVVLLNLLLYVGPLLCFSPKLVAVKRRGLREYGAVATAYVQSFDAKWLRGGYPPRESFLGSGDIQSLNDLAGGFGVIRQMRVVPFGPALVLLLIGASLLPMAPLLFLAFPLDELLGLAAKLILGV
jgi:hypothetical protein